MTRGEKESFNWTRFKDVLGSGDGNGGSSSGPFLPSRVLAVSEQAKGGREGERGGEGELQYRMSSACSVLTAVKTSLPQSSATAASANTQVDQNRARSKRSHVAWRPYERKRGERVRPPPPEPPPKPIFMYHTYCKNKC